jgi:hypothetical protein
MKQAREKINYTPTEIYSKVPHNLFTPYSQLPAIIRAYRSLQRLPLQALMETKWIEVKNEQNRI